MYYQDPGRDRGQLKFGKIQREYVQLLGEKDLLPLKGFLENAGRMFRELVSLAYAETWAFMHLLRHGSADHKALFRRLMKELRSGATPSEVVERVLPEGLLESLDQDLEEHLLAMGR